MASTVFMYQRRCSLCTAILIILIGLFTIASARDIKVTVGHIPGLADSPEKGTFIELLKAMDEAYAEGKFIISVYPFPRSIANVIEGQADFHIPLVSDPRVDMDTVPYRFASTPMGTVSIVLYSTTNKQLTKEMILKAAKQKPFPYSIELNRGSEIYYDFPTIPSSEIITSYRKLEIARIDAFMGAQEEGDAMCRELKLKNVRRELWEAKPDLFVIPKGPKGDEIDKIIAETMKKIIQNGKQKEIYSKIHLPYDNWQPYQTTY
ncbi:MAG: hypothetical protein JW795_21730 [Chitinivibrionales bacterium]|nr:hypothetical protein [Chitinivibrionales bacterium]